MEFKLNKIDPDLRRQVNEASKEGKVHGANHDLVINKEKKQDHEKNNFTEQKKNNGKILVKAVKIENMEVDAFSEENLETYEVKGRFLDVRK